LVCFNQQVNSCPAVFELSVKGEKLTVEIGEAVFTADDFGNGYHLHTPVVFLTSRQNFSERFEGE
jgi:hypothetical protein